MTHTASGMYSLGLEKSFRAKHRLMGGDWGGDDDPRVQTYRMEITLFGNQPGRHGYLMDIADLEKAADGLVGRYEGAVLNELPDFAGLNPSLERFARICWDQLAESINTMGISLMRVRLWEGGLGWAQFEMAP